MRLSQASMNNMVGDDDATQSNPSTNQYTDDDKIEGQDVMQHFVAGNEMTLDV